jgi:hypothetical protein
MAEVQLFEPEFNEIFTDRGWRAAFAGRTGVVCDTNGSAFGLTLPAEGSTVEIGSPSIPSRLVVDGFGLEVPAGTTQSLSIPASASGGTTGRTDLIVGRLTTGPVDLQLHRIPGTEGSLALPAASYSATGTRDLLLYAFRRRQGEGLNQAIVTDLRPRIGHHYLVPAGGTLPGSASLGDHATRGGTVYRYDFVGSSPDWVEEWRARTVLTGADVVQSPGEGFLRRDGSRLVRDNTSRDFTYTVWKGFPARNPNPAEDGALIVGKLHDQDKPISPDQVALSGWAIDEGGTTRAAMGYVAFNGDVVWSWASANTPFGADGRDKTLVLHGTWQVA